MKIISTSLLCAWVGVLALGLALAPTASTTPAIPDDVRYVAAPNCASQSDQSYFDGLGGGFDGCPPIAPAKLDPNAVCSLLATGYSQVDVAERLEVGNPNLNFDKAEQYVAGVAPTCPSPSSNGSVANSGQAAPPSPGSSAPAIPISGADSQGFLSQPGARCNSVDHAVVIGSTADSALVICLTPHQYYYKELGLKNGLANEIDGLVRQGDTFVAASNNGGYQYSVSPKGVLITQGNSVISNEPMREYWAAQ
jgi:hypothetical protein